MFDKVNIFSYLYIKKKSYLQEIMKKKVMQCVLRMIGWMKFW